MKNEYDFEVKNNTPPVSELRKQLQIGVWLFAFAAAAFLGGLQSMSLQVARALNEFSLGMCGGTADFLAAHLTNNFFVDNISTALTSALLVLVVYYDRWQLRIFGFCPQRLNGHVGRFDVDCFVFADRSPARNAIDF